MKKFLNLTIAFFLSISISIGQFNASFVEFLEESMVLIDEELDPIGLSISVRSGDDVWNGAIGISSAQDSLTSNSILAMGSITKTFISAGILKLMEDNILSLSDPLHMYLPSFDHIDSTITIKELLNHTSGIHNFTTHPLYFDSIFTDQNQFYTYSPEEVLEQFVLEKLFDRGTAHEYSNTNYILLGMIITEIANRPFYEEIFEIFDIEQNYPSFSCPPFNSEISDLADLWADIGNGMQNFEELGIGLKGFFSSTAAGGAFVGTPSDLSQWGYDLYSGKLLSESSMDSLFDYHPFLVEGETKYGLGVESFTSSCGVNTVGHNGNIFYLASLYYFEEYDLSVTVMTNDANAVDAIFLVPDETICAYKEFPTTSSNDIVKKDEVEIYPNPVSDIISIDLPEVFGQSAQIEIYNEIGTLVYTQKILNPNSQTLIIDCFSEQPKGFYFIKIFDEENAYTEKLIKG